jgi:hypothetical protein
MTSKLCELHSVHNNYNNKHPIIFTVCHWFIRSTNLITCLFDIAGSDQNGCTNYWRHAIGVILFVRRIP